MLNIAVCNFYFPNILFNSVATNSTWGPIITCTVSFEGFNTPGTNFLISVSFTLALSLTFNLSLVVQLSTSTILSAPPNKPTNDSANSEFVVLIFIASAFSSSLSSLPGVFKLKALITNRNTKWIKFLKFYIKI